MLPETLFGTDLGYVAAMSVVLAGFFMVVLRHEAGVPLVLSVLFIPPIIAAGFGIAIAIHVWFAIPVLYASGLLGGVLFTLLVCYEAMSTGSSPRATRHRF